MSSIIHCISDLHLSEQQPHLLKLLEHYMQNIAPRSQQLYVLGDLFEVWVGDDNISPLNSQVTELFSEYSKHHGELFLLHGNRDFLLGDQFATRCGACLLNEPFKLHWNNHIICMMHGDILCSDDIKYQEFRSMVRKPQWQAEFLSHGLSRRLEVASGLREQSKEAQSSKQMEIMDVNQQTVIDTIKQNNCNCLIHGHTHRQAVHQHTLGNHQEDATRIVLSDWGNQGHYLELQQETFQNHYFTLP